MSLKVFCPHLNGMSIVSFSESVDLRPRTYIEITHKRAQSARCHDVCGWLGSDQNGPSMLLIFKYVINLGASRLVV